MHTWYELVIYFPPRLKQTDKLNQTLEACNEKNLVIRIRCMNQ